MANPYQAPASTLTEQVKRFPPLPVWAAIGLLLFDTALNHTERFLAGWYTTLLSASGLVVGILLTTLVSIGLYRQRNWTRRLLMALILVGLVFKPWPELFGSPYSAARTVMAGLLFVLLLLSGSSYRPNNSSKPTPLRGAA